MVRGVGLSASGLNGVFCGSQSLFLVDAARRLFAVRRVTELRAARLVPRASSQSRLPRAASQPRLPREKLFHYFNSRIDKAALGRPSRHMIPD